MRDFIALFAELDATSRTSVKLDALKRYFDRAPADDGAWAVTCQATEGAPPLLRIWQVALRSELKK